MNAQQQKPVNTKALAWTVGVHAVIILLLLFISYSVPANENTIEEMGMEVNLGTDPNGSGTDQPMAMDEPSPEVTARGGKAAGAESNETKEMETGNEADAPVVNTPSKTNINRNNNTTERKRARTTTPQQNTNTAVQQRPRYVYSGSNGKGGNSASTNQAGTSEGNTNGNGDRGVPGGTPGASNYEGSPGPGTGGISHTLSGRSISPSRFEAEFNEGGKVVISVTVDRDGNIINKRIKSSSSSRLNNLALQKLGQAKFSKSPNAEPQQFGEITILFKTR
jgi:TonB family protein